MYRGVLRPNERGIDLDPGLLSLSLLRWLEGCLKGDGLRAVVVLVVFGLFLLVVTLITEEITVIVLLLLGSWLRFVVIEVKDVEGSWLFFRLLLWWLFISLFLRLFLWFFLGYGFLLLGRRAFFHRRGLLNHPKR